MELSVSCQLLLYADDSVLLVSGENPKDISNTLTKELQTCSEWLVDNKLSLHLGKTEAILCGSRRKLKNVQDFEVKYNGVSIKSVSAVKYLGINIDSDMSGETTWKTVMNKCNSRLKFMYRQARCLPTATKKTLCLALTQCNFDYAVPSWYPSKSQTAKKKLQVVQNKIIRFILNLGPRDPIGTEQLNTLGVLNVEDRTQQIRLHNTHKVYCELAPKYSMTNFNKSRNRRGMNTRHRAYNFNLPRVTGEEEGTFYYNAIKDWNGLPDRLKTCSNLLSFKSKLKQCMLEAAINRPENQYVFY